MQKNTEKHPKNAFFCLSRFFMSIFFLNFAAKSCKSMSKTLKDRLDYLIALVSEFAAAHHLSLQQAYLYLQRYKGLDFADEFYDVEHTLSFDQAVEDVTMYCQRMGGTLA